MSTPAAAMTEPRMTRSRARALGTPLPQAPKTTAAVRTRATREDDTVGEGDMDATAEGSIPAPCFDAKSACADGTELDTVSTPLAARDQQEALDVVPLESKYASPVGRSLLRSLGQSVTPAATASSTQAPPAGSQSAVKSGARTPVFKQPMSPAATTPAAFTPQHASSPVPAAVAEPRVKFATTPVRSSPTSAAATISAAAKKSTLKAGAAALSTPGGSRHQADAVTTAGRSSKRVSISTPQHPKSEGPTRQIVRTPYPTKSASKTLQEDDDEACFSPIGGGADAMAQDLAAEAECMSQDSFSEQAAAGSPVASSIGSLYQEVELSSSTPAVLMGSPVPAVTYTPIPTPAPTPTAVRTPAAQGTRTPVRTSARTPARTPAAAAPACSPVPTPTRTPAAAPARTPAPTPVRTPKAEAASTPVLTAARTPMLTTAHTPAPTAVSTPMAEAVHSTPAFLPFELEEQMEVEAAGAAPAALPDSVAFMATPHAQNLPETEAATPVAFMQGLPAPASTPLTQVWPATAAATPLTQAPLPATAVTTPLTQVWPATAAATPLTQAPLSAASAATPYALMDLPAMAAAAPTCELMPCELTPRELLADEATDSDADMQMGEGQEDPLTALLADLGSPVAEDDEDLGMVSEELEELEEEEPFAPMHSLDAAATETTEGASEGQAMEHAAPVMASPKSQLTPILKTAASPAPTVAAAASPTPVGRGASAAPGPVRSRPMSAAPNSSAKYNQAHVALKSLAAAEASAKAPRVAAVRPASAQPDGHMPHYMVPTSATLTRAVKPVVKANAGTDNRSMAQIRRELKEVTLQKEAMAKGMHATATTQVHGLSGVRKTALVAPKAHVRDTMEEETEDLDEEEHAAHQSQAADLSAAMGGLGLGVGVPMASNVQLRGVPAAAGRHMRFDDQGDGEETPSSGRPSLLGVPTATGTHMRFKD